jgi:hypothetical protein
MGGMTDDCRKPDPLYGKIIANRRRRFRFRLSVALMVVGFSLLVAAFLRHSAALAIIGVAVMAVASQTPVPRKKRDDDAENNS